MQLTARGAQRRRDESTKLMMYSKQWMPGDTLRVFYPLVWNDGIPDIVVGAVWGHNVGDLKTLGLKTVFIPSTTDFDQDKRPIGAPDITYRFSQIAPLFLQGQKILEEQHIESTRWPSEAAKKAALLDLEKKYDPKNTGSDRVNPIISYVKYLITTEVASVKIVNQLPVTETLSVSSAPLSKQTINKLYQILEDPKYAPEQGERFLEVEWKYPVVTDRGEAGRTATVMGVTAEYRLCNTAPSSMKQIESTCEQIMFDSESIRRRAVRMIDPNRVKQAITRYSFMNAASLDVLSPESEEQFLSNVELIKELDIAIALNNEELKNKINAALAEAANHSAIEEMVPTPDVTPNPATADATVPGSVSVENIPEPPVTDIPDLTGVEGSPTVQDLLGGGSIQSLMEGADNAENALGGDSLDMVDFGMV